MSYSKIEELKNIGIEIHLTKDGQEILSSILSDGCPIKFSNHYPEHINCPMKWESSQLNCKLCWKQWLKDFLVKE